MPDNDAAGNRVARAAAMPEPSEQLLPSLRTKIEMPRLWTPGANLARQFDLHGDFLNGRRNALGMEITDKAIGSDPHIAPLLGRAEVTSGWVVDFLKPSPVIQCEINCDPRREWSIRAHIRLGIEDHDDGRAVIEVSVELPPFVASLFDANALATLEWVHFDGNEPGFW
jgi:hypothetical protein